MHMMLYYKKETHITMHMMLYYKNKTWCYITKSTPYNDAYDAILQKHIV